ncbi:MAG: type IV pilus twitching motility protein PilT [Polyangiaceae bacterium]
MARIDSILAMLQSQGANELRVGADREPKIFAFGTPKRFSMPATSEETLRALLGELLSPEREQTLASKGRVDFSYEAPGLGGFQVGMASRAGGGFDVTFLKSARAQREPAREIPPPRQPASPALHLVEPQAAPHPQSAEPSPEDTFRPDASELEAMIAHAAALRASDLHLSAGETPRARVDGALVPLEIAADSDLAAILPLTRAELDRVNKGESVDRGLEMESGARVRLHVFRTSRGIAAAVRLLPQVAPSISSLHMPVSLDAFADLRQGLVLVCGATGSGKSTTLAAICQEILRRRSIVLTTLEDPIEYGLTATSSSLMRRREIGRDVPDFASGIRDALREDPDVVLIGELRDAESIANAMTAAETGHLVLASLHSAGVASAVERIVDAFSADRQEQVRGQLANCLRAVLAQRLLPRARGSGRLPAIELLRVNHAVAALLREGKTAQLATAMQSGKGEWMIALERCLADRVLAKEIKLEDARAAANDADSLMTFLPK